MKKNQRVLREILHRTYERGERFMSQKTLAQVCGISLGSVNPVINKLAQIGAVETKPMGLRVINPKRILIYWASTRDLARDIAYGINSHMSLKEIEASMPKGAVLTAYSGYRARFGSVPAEYEAVYVYADPAAMKRKFPPGKGRKKNLLVLTPDPHLSRLSKGGIAPLAQIYVDLWQLGVPANRFVEELDGQLEPAAMGALQTMIEKTREQPSAKRRSSSSE